MDAVLLPRFSCHILRHTCTTRICQAGVKVSTTMNIYADVTKELETTEFENLDRHFTAWMKDADENGDVEQVSRNNLYEQRKKYIFLHTPFYAD